MVWKEKFSIQRNSQILNLAQEIEKIKNHPDFTIIGHAVDLDQGNYLVARGSSELIPLNAQGWDAFLNKDSNDRQ